MLSLLQKLTVDRSIPLDTVSKLIVRLRRLMPRRRASGKLHVLQSVYCLRSFNENCFAEHLGQNYELIDCKQVTAMVSLDISAAFDIVNDYTLL